jgi:hypothetical protein
VIDDAGAPVLLGEPVPYSQVMTAALAFFDEAIAAGPGGAGRLTIHSRTGWERSRT